jgi:hypothetical protein
MCLIAAGLVLRIARLKPASPVEEPPMAIGAEAPAYS